MSRWHGTAKTPAGLVHFVFDETDQQLVSARFDPRDVDGAVRKRSPVHDAFAQYRDGALDSFNEIYVLQGNSPFIVKVYATMREIPVGTAQTYGELAARAGHPRAARAVGTACGRNEVVIVIPCHRVVASNGIGGYGYGVDVKTKLLIHEGVEGY
jgi:methylated-DNA-[protein]-cysteine S-methyltransferase